MARAGIVGVGIGFGLAMGLGAIAGMRHETCQAPVAVEAQPAGAQPLSSDFAMLAPLIGDWEVSAQWQWGDTLKARNEYRVGIAGRFLEVRTIVRDNDGPEYVRYKTVYAVNPDAAGDPKAPEFIAYGFAVDGSVTVLPVSLEDGVLRMRMDGKGGGPSIRQEAGPFTDTGYKWKVEMLDGAEWTVVMDAEYKRVK